MEFEGKQVVWKQVDDLIKMNQDLRNELEQVKSKATYRVYQENMNLVDIIIELNKKLNAMMIERPDGSDEPIEGVRK